jgi:hypothetical protein
MLRKKLKYGNTHMQLRAIFVRLTFSSWLYRSFRLATLHSIMTGHYTAVSQSSEQRVAAAEGGRVASNSSR